MRAIKQCRACGSARLETFLDLGKQRISDFREDMEIPPAYPLVAALCLNCKLVQLKHTVPQAEMYHENYGFKSGINDSIKRDLDNVVWHAFQYVNDPKIWLDIACNDGTLLSFVPTNITRVGVDPVKFLCEEAAEHADDIINDFYSRESLADYKEGFDVITAVSCFYDMPDPQQLVADVKYALGHKGVWVIQQNYLLTTLQLGAIDNFCHEHLEYYTLLSLENLLTPFGLEVNEVQTSMINGGSLRTIVSRRGDYPVDSSVAEQRGIEEDFGIERLFTYQHFASNTGLQLMRLRNLVNQLKADNKRVAILAASTRGATIWQSADIGPEDIVYAVERNPAKVGKMFSAIGVPIVSEAFAREDKPDYMLIGPWFFSREIVAREYEYVQQGGQLIVPLPEVTIIDKDNIDEYLQ